MSLESLPSELLTYIHLLSLSPSLPSTSRYLHSVLSVDSSPHQKAVYLYACHFRNKGVPSKLLSRCLRYPLCDMRVVGALERIVERDNEECKEGRKVILKCSDMPKRLLRGLVDNHNNTGSPIRGHDKADLSFETLPHPTLDLTLIHYLLSHYQASANSQKGYFLAKAVASHHLPLIKMLLRYGADPSLKNGYAVVVAIGMGNRDLVKLLLERGGEWGREEVEEADQDQDVEGSEVLLSVGKSKKRRRSSVVSPEKYDWREEGETRVKKRKTGETDERCKATEVMLEAAARGKHWHIFEYLRERGAVPSIAVLKLI